MSFPTPYQEFIYKRTYARWLEDQGRRESWHETVARYEDCLGKKVPASKKYDWHQACDAIRALEIMPSMRSLWASGPALERENMAGFNCLSGETLVTTLEYGIIPIKDVAGKSVHVVDGNGEWVLAKCSSFGKQDVSMVMFGTSGTGRFYVKATPNHRWIKKDGSVATTSELVSGDRIASVKMPERPLIDEESEDYKNGVIHGIVYGDGTAHYKLRSGGRTTCIDKFCSGFAIRLCGASKRELLQYFEGFQRSYPKTFLGDPVVSVPNRATDLKSLPDIDMGLYSDSYLVGFLRGWLATDGSVTTKSQVSLCSNKEGIDWLEHYGPKYGFCVTSKQKLGDTNYIRTEETYDALLDRRWIYKGDFLVQSKKDNFTQVDSKKSPGFGKIVAIVPCGKEEVFCFNVPTTHSFLLTKNLLTGNCSYAEVSTIKSFAEILYILMCGTGVGFSVERQVVAKLPFIPDKLEDVDDVIVVSDSKRGWAEAYLALLRALYDGKIKKWDVSRVRPKGAKLKIFGGRASGPDPLVDLFKFTIRIFKSACGRKLSSLECHDIVCKTASIVVCGGVRRSACISLSNLSDDRMAHAKDGMFWDTNPQRMLANNSVAYTEKPDTERFMQEWLNLIRSKSGERGIFNRESAKFIVSQIGRRDPNYDWGTNPCCFTGDTRLLTTMGYMPMDMLVDTEFDIVNHNGVISTGKVWEVGLKDIVEIVFEAKGGRKPIRCTPDHRFMLNDGSECQAIDLKGKRLMPYVKKDYGFIQEDILAGFIFGDANLTRLSSVSHLGMEVYFGTKDADVANLFGRDVGTWYSREAVDIANKWGLKPQLTYDKTMPNDVTRSFLRGLYSANGCVVKESRVAYKTASKELAIGLSKTLTGYGIQSYITTNKAHNIAHSNGTYESKESYDVNIGRYESLLIFASEIGFVQKYKCDSLDKLLIKKAPYVKTVRPAGSDVVYDFNEPKTSWGVVEGVIAHNSEIILRPNETCNLSEVVVRPNDTIKTLKEKVRYATILGIIQSTYTDFQFISRDWKRNCDEERLLGVSLTGLRDHAVLGHKSREAELMLIEMKQTAIDTAKEWSEILGINMPAAITCTKPSGSVSQLVDSASGLHHRYSPYYIRRVRVNASDPLALVLADSGVPYNPEVGETMENANTWVFDFPIKAPENAVFRDEETAIQQLEYWLMIQKCWCEHKPSITVFVKEDEWLEIGFWVFKNWNYVSGISFLPMDGGVYQLAPYEEITEEQYIELVEKMPEIDFDKLIEYEREDTTQGSREFACQGNSCELV